MLHIFYFVYLPCVIYVFLHLFIQFYLFAIAICVHYLFYNDIITWVLLNLIMFILISATSTHFRWELMLCCLHCPTLKKCFHTFSLSSVNFYSTTSLHRCHKNCPMVEANAKNFSFLLPIKPVLCAGIPVSLIGTKLNITGCLRSFSQSQFYQNAL